MRFWGLTSALLVCGVLAASCGADGPTAADLRSQSPGATVTIAPTPTVPTTTAPVTTPASPHNFDDWTVYFEIPERELTVTSRGFEPRVEIDYVIAEERPFQQRLIEVQSFELATDASYTETTELRGRISPRRGGIVIELENDAGSADRAALSLLADNKAAVLSTGADPDIETLARFDAAIGALIPLPDEPVGVGARWFTHTNLFEASSVPGTFEVLEIQSDSVTLRVFGTIRDRDTRPGMGFGIEATLGGTLEIDLRSGHVDGSVLVAGTGTALDESTGPFVQSFTFESG